MSTNISVSVEPGIKTPAVTKAKGLGLTRSVTQVLDTIQFEFVRNFKKIMIVLLLYTGIFGLFFIIDQISISRGMELPAESLDYFMGYLGMINFLIYISAATFGGSIIVVDYEKLTGHLIFPKISKDRLLLGRFIAAYGMNALVVLYYYVLSFLATASKYDEMPDHIWDSMGLALLFTLAVLSFVVLWSSLMRTTTAAVVMSIMLLLIVFTIISSIMQVATQAEPIFLLNYYGNTISTVFDMPDPRYMDMTVGISETDTITLRTWLTPSISTACYGMLTYTAICLIIAYIRFKTRQLLSASG